MTTTNQPSDAAKLEVAETLCTERCAQAGDPPCSKVDKAGPHCDECLGMAQAVFDRHLTPSEPVAWLLEWPNAENGAPMRAVTISKPEVIAGENLTPLYATPPAPANSDAGLVEADAALEAVLKAAKAQLQECAQCLLDAELTIQSLSAIPAVNAELVEAAQELEARAYTSYRARNGRMCSIEGDDGEQAFIVPYDAMMALRAALRAQAGEGE